MRSKKSMAVRGFDVKGNFEKKDMKQKKQKQKNNVENMPKNKDKSKKKCFQCNKMRHFRKDCPKLKSNERGEEDEANALIVSSQGYFDSNVLMATTTNIENQ